MRPAFPLLLSIALLSATLPGFATSQTVHKKPAVKKVVSSHSKHSRVTAKKKTAISHAPMDTERATQIQTALIRSGYLSGDASGRWDAESQAAMQKLQSDNGWQTKIVPDSRALIKLGLGPNAAPTPN